MAQVINTNVASLNAQRNLNSSQAGTNQALERLSSGLRINSAKDDAAGLAISTRFQSQINGFNVAVRNAGDGVSLAQTAEGALGSVTDSLQRIRELALQSTNGTNSAADREALNAEAQQLLAEVSRATKESNFNGLKLLDGSFNSQFQIGANAGETISVSIAKLTSDTLGVSAESGVSSLATADELSQGDLVINGVTVGASRASDDTASTASQSASAIAKAAAINRVAAESGVTALVDENIAAGSAQTASALSGSVTINGTAINIDTTGDAASSRSAVVTAINAQSELTGVTAVDSGDDALGVSLVAADGRNIELSFTTLTSAATGLAAAGTFTGGVTLVADSDVNQIAISGNNVAKAGLSAGTFTAGVASVSSLGTVAAAATAATAAEVTVGNANLSSINFDFSTVTSAGTAATITGTAGIAAIGTDFSAGGADVAFTLTTTDGGAQNVTINGDFTDATIGGGAGSGNTALLANINGQIVGSGFTASLDGSNQLVFTEDANDGDTVTFADNGGTTNAETFFSLTGAGATDTGVAATTATNATFDVAVDGGAVQSVDVNVNAIDSTTLLTEINGQLTGATASLDATTGFLVITSSTTGATSEITTSNLGGAAGSLAALGIQAATGTGTAAGASNFDDLNAGDLVINNVSIGAAKVSDDTASFDAAASSSKAASGISIAEAINRSTDATGVTATVNATETKGTAATTAGTSGATGTLYLNGVEISLTVQSSADANRASAINQINSVSGQTGVIAEDNGSSLTLTAADGRNIVLALDTNGATVSAANFGLGGAGISESDFTDGGATGIARANTDATTTFSSVTLSSAGTIEVSGGTNGNAGLEGLGLRQGEFGGAVSGQFLNQVDISTQEGAITALNAIDNALNSVNSARADLGAIQNRFETTISNLELTSENLSAANSRIQDADFAAEAAALSRNQVLQQAGISILSQANAAPQQVLSLLQ
ncbi:MAG: flagellin [Pseudomonadales bacterium]|nr:flagellin [Pseudomonadales bacterium]